MSGISDMLDNFARMQGGGRTYNFSQGQAFRVAQAVQRVDIRHKSGTWNDQGKMYKMVLRGNTPGHMSEMGGVCATIAAFWVIFHAMQDYEQTNAFTRGRSVWQYLFDHNGLNMGAATNITVEHHQSSAHQLVYLENLLRKFKVKRRNRTMTGAANTHHFVPFNMSTTMSCANEITKVNGYKLIELKRSLDGSGGGHMVAAWSDMQDVLFMDPNLGEFWLPNARAFKAWLTVFWGHTYGRNNQYKSMRVHDFAYKA